MNMEWIFFRVNLWKWFKVLFRLQWLHSSRISQSWLQYHKWSSYNTLVQLVQLPNHTFSNHTYSMLFHHKIAYQFFTCQSITNFIFNDEMCHIKCLLQIQILQAKHKRDMYLKAQLSSSCSWQLLPINHFTLFWTMIDSNKWTTVF